MSIPSVDLFDLKTSPPAIEIWDGEWREAGSKDPFKPFPVTHPRVPTESFKDCFDRPIAIGDVLAHGFRAGNYGGINVGVVYGFTEHNIQLYRAKEVYHCEHNPYRRVHDGWEFVKTLTSLAENTFITGLTEQQLRQQLGIVS